MVLRLAATVLQLAKGVAPAASVTTVVGRVTLVVLVLMAAATWRRTHQRCFGGVARVAHKRAAFSRKHQQFGLSHARRQARRQDASRQARTAVVHSLPEPSSLAHLAEDVHTPAHGLPRAQASAGVAGKSGGLGAATGSEAGGAGEDGGAAARRKGGHKGV